MPPVRIPSAIARRAWECALDIRDRGDEDVPLEVRIRAEVVVRGGPESIGWTDAGIMLRVHRHLWEVRV